MKRISVIQLKCYALVLLLSLASNFASAQSDQHDLLLNHPNGSAIIRHWQEKYFVSFSRRDASLQTFSLIDESGMTFSSFRTDCDLDVHDMEIAGKKVYFCGEDSVGPLLGYFDIPLLFSSGMGMSVVHLNGSWPSVYDTLCTEEITGLNKLEVQLCNDGVRVYVVGTSSFSCSEYPTRCIVDMRYDPAINSWFGSFAQEYGGVFYYDDVAVTDTNVIVIGHKNGSSGYYLSSYTKPNSAILPLLTYPNVPYYYSGGGDGYNADPNRPLLIEHLYDDYYAVAGYANTFLNDVWDRGTVISIFNAGTHCLNRFFVSQGFADTAKWGLYDLRYNKDVGRLYLLQRMSNPVSSSIQHVLCEFVVPASGSIMAAQAFYEPGAQFSSLDKSDGNGWNAVLMGKRKGMDLWLHEFGSDCVKKKDLSVRPFMTEQNVMMYPQCPVPLKVYEVPVSGTLSSNPIETYCR